MIMISSARHSVEWRRSLCSRTAGAKEWRLANRAAIAGVLPPARPPHPARPHSISQSHLRGGKNECGASKATDLHPCLRSLHIANDEPRLPSERDVQNRATHLNGFGIRRGPSPRRNRRRRSSRKPKQRLTIGRRVAAILEHSSIARKRWQVGERVVERWEKSDQPASRE